VHRPGHVGAALLAYAPLAGIATALGAAELAVGGAIGAVALAPLPDYDQRVPLLAHRGLTHTVWFALLVGVVLAAAGLALAGRRPLATVTTALFAGLVGTLTVCSHVAADALTPAGVRPFAPLRNRRYTCDLVRAANPIANYALLGLGGAAVVAALVSGSTLASGWL